MNAETCVGKVTAADWFPYLECGIGYVKFSRPGNWAGQLLSMMTPQGDRVDCEIVSLPFYDAEKQIPRSLEPIDN